jgi:hypothetical protein
VRGSPARYDVALGKDADFDDVDAAIEVHVEAMSLRMMYVHRCNEDARHYGHADLLREAIGGVTGR